MTIKSTGVLDLENRCPSQTIICSGKTSDMSSSRSIKMKVSSKDSSSLGSNKHKDHHQSPYFVSDKVHLPRRVTDKRPHKNPNKFVSSFPLAVSVYKANSDEFKLTKCGNKKVRKSVLTLPNKPAPMPKTYTVSDLNDSEYFNDTNNDSSKNGANKPKKRRTIKRKRKPRMHERAIEYYDRDARYCSQLNIDLDCSSSDILNLTGDGENISNLYKSNNSIKAGTDQNDVWSVLRNINKFQFRPSPHASQESVVPLRKRRPAIRKINNCNDTHIIETCHTEEFSYISSFEVDSRSQGSCSPSSSFDRVTVIDQQNDKGSIIEQFSQNIFESKQNFRSQIRSNARKSRNKTKNINYPQVRNEQIMQNKKKLEIEPAPENIAPNNILQLEDENVNPFCKNELMSPVKIEQQRSVQNSIYNDSVYENQASNVAAVNRVGDTSRLKNKSLLRRLTKKDNNITKKSDVIDAEKEINGITKVVVSRGQDLVSSKISESQRKPRLALTIPNTNITKLSQAEIRRRLANLIFPIVVLGKDQLTDQGIPVVNYDPPQFRGLDKQIWPFMSEWLEVKHLRNNEISQKKKAIPKIRQKIYNEDDLTTMMGDIKKISEKPDRTTNKNIANFSTLNKREPLVTKDLSRPIVVQKPKPVSFLKNKMFSFLQKSPMSTKLSESNWKNSELASTVQKDKFIDTCETSETTNKLRYRSGTSSPINKETKTIDSRVINKQYSSLRHPWAKGKWASDFIENIIKKMRNGVYYGVGHKEIKCQIHGSEISTQTEASILKNAYCQNNIDSLQVASNEDDALKNILDVDKNFSTLEIETITSNQIAVKHCLTNVVIRFDIQVYGEVKTALDNKALSCIPINVQDNDEKVFKCNTSIVNAFLPAELCTMIPSIMETMLNADKILYQNFAHMETVQSQLSSVSDSMGFTSTGLLKPSLWMQSYLPGLTICDEIKPLLMGRYPVKNSNLKIYKSTDFLLPKDTYDSIISLLPTIRVHLFFRFIQMSPQHTFENKLTKLNSFDKKPNHYIDRKTDCMALQPYEPKNLSVIPSFGIFNPTEFLKNIIIRMKNNNEVNITMTFMSYNINCDIIHHISQEQNQIQNYPTPKVGLISLYDAFNKSDHNNDRSTDKTFENGMESKPSSFATGKNKNKQQKKTLQPMKTLVKKSFVKCYRKCNSLSSISTYKSTPLNLIKNIEDFCIAFGSNSFCSVLDGYIVKKILAAIREMESWISEITPKQALLILLLSNKKDTPNLIRFRPILLQGIAVNRITKAVELDTEIEVIENENFHKSTLYERFSYTPTCAKNQHNLLEELYWIAKTTASDYQKPFDESSEKLLKSLLEKRKKLNPSYLRVMARYVGLGLLKPSK